ncbi:unnamed protein product [Rhizophagus irregularis]|nr:unnamed protein product [Rhizophagus irregularis]
MEFSDIQLRILIDERKNRSVEYYHTTTNKKKYLFWNEIAEKINDQENTNYFTGDACHKKFLGLTKAFYTAEKYKEGTGMRSCLVGKEIYEEFSTMFWLKPELPFEQVRNENVRSSSANSPEALSSSISPKWPKGKSSLEQPLEKAVKESPTIGASGKSSSLATSSNPVETPNISRPVTLTISFFSQNANMINVTFNYGGASEDD